MLPGSEIYSRVSAEPWKWFSQRGQVQRDSRNFIRARHSESSSETRHSVTLKSTGNSGVYAVNFLEEAPGILVTLLHDSVLQIGDDLGLTHFKGLFTRFILIGGARSEERRIGKEWRSG